MSMNKAVSSEQKPLDVIAMGQNMGDLWSANRVAAGGYDDFR